MKFFDWILIVGFFVCVFVLAGTLTSFAVVELLAGSSFVGVIFSVIGGLMAYGLVLGIGSIFRRN